MNELKKFRRFYEVLHDEKDLLSATLLDNVTRKRDLYGLGSFLFNC